MQVMLAPTASVVAGQLTLALLSLSKIAEIETLPVFVST